ncbi:hypothetical protein TRVL_07446 [Trypanosoma vivax]|nr:hypothetical protein TRVL_07446 [Trypanosoma vivax]
MRSAGAAVHDVLSLRLNVTAGVAGLALEQRNRVRFTLARVVFTVNVATSAIQTLYVESLEGDMRHFSTVLYSLTLTTISRAYRYHSTRQTYAQVSLGRMGEPRAACDSIVAFSVRNISQWNYSSRSVSCLVVQLF